MNVKLTTVTSAFPIGPWSPSAPTAPAGPTGPVDHLHQQDLHMQSLLEQLEVQLEFALTLLSPFHYLPFGMF